MKTCTLCHSYFDITDDDLNYYKKVDCPTPDECPTCRERARVVFRNDRNYYPFQCEKCHKSGISIYRPGTIPHLLCQKCFWSDTWSAKDTGRDFDFSKTFTENFALLAADTPRIAMMNDNGLTSENCEYTYDWYKSKNCYLTQCGWIAENCYYSFRLGTTKDCMDVYFAQECEQLYECIYSTKSYGCRYCQQIHNCTDCIFVYNCIGCKNCLFCTNLSNKQYYIRNTPYSREDYEQEIKKLHLGSWTCVQNLKKHFGEFLKIQPKKYADIVNSQNCTGDHLYRCKDCHESYEMNDMIGGKYFRNGDVAKHCYDCNMCGETEWCHNSLVADYSYMVGFSLFCRESKFCLYCDNCNGCDDCFGCMSLRKSQYSILNREYSKEAYMVLRERIIEHMKKTGEWGRFFDPSLCPHGYNETLAMEWYQIEKDEAEKLGYTWQDKLPGSLGKETVKTDELPDDVEDFNSADERIVNGIFACESCQKNYKFIPQELKFYIDQGIPLPHICAHCRHNNRVNLANPAKLRACVCDGILENGQVCKAICHTAHPPGTKILC